MASGGAQRGWNQKRHGERWRSLRWSTLGLLALLAIGLGMIGFDRHLRAVGEPRTASGLLYLSLQLFILESGALPGRLPWQLEVARLLAPGIALFTAIQALAVVFRDKLQEVRARRMRGHVVVCGLGRKGRLLARRFREAGEAVVAIERGDDEPAIRLCREAGVVVLLGDATEPATLRRAGVARARLLVAVCGGDGDNATIAVMARRLVTGRTGAPLVTVVHLLDDELCALLRERELSAVGRDGFRLEFFNVFESGAEAMLDEIPWRGDPSPHLVIVGLGHFGASLLRRMVRRRRGAAAAARPRVTVVDYDAARLARARSEFASECILTTCELDVRAPAFAAARFAADDEGRPSTSGVYVCLDDDGAAITAGLALHRRLGGSGVPIAVRLEEETGLATLLARRPGESNFPDLHGFGLLERTCRPERLLAASRERLAQEIHASYRAQQLAAGKSPADNPALVPWALLPEGLRESNRAQADDIGRKLAAVGCEMHLEDGTADAPFALTPAEIERLAELEHERFVEERQAAGCRFAPGPKIPERKTSRHLVPWAELDEPTRQIDRDTIRGIPGFLAAIGYAVKRRERSAAQTRASGAGRPGRVVR